MISVPFQPPQAGWWTTLRIPRGLTSGHYGTLSWMRQTEYWTWTLKRKWVMCECVCVCAHVRCVDEGRRNGREFTKSYAWMGKCEQIGCSNSKFQLLSLSLPQVDKILKVVPRQRVTYLYSATMTKKVQKLQRASLHDPVKIEVSTKYVGQGSRVKVQLSYMSYVGPPGTKLWKNCNRATFSFQASIR